MGLLQAAAIALVALVLAPGFFFYFDVTPKIVVLFGGVAVMLLARIPRPVSPPVKRFLWLLAGTAVSVLVSSALSSNRGLSFFGTNWRRFGATTQIAVLCFAGLVALHGRIRVLLRGIVVAGLISALYGIAQYFGWDPILPAAGYHIGEGIWTIVRPPGTLGYVSYFATWLLFVAFLSLELAEREESVWWRRLAYAASALATCAMLLTGTRAAMLGLVAGVGVWLYRIGFRVTKGMVAGAVVAVVAGAAFYFSDAGWQLHSRGRWYAEDRWGGGRPALWRDSLKMAAARLPLGYGPEVFTATFPRFESKELARAYPDFAHESPHNIFLDALVAQGVPGLVLLGAVCWVGLAGARPWVAAALTGGIVAQQFTVFTMPTALVFYGTVALAVQAREEGRPGGLRYGCLLAIAFVYLAVRYCGADVALAMTRNAINAGDLTGAMARYGQYDRWRLPGGSADLWYSRALLDAAQKASNPVIRLQGMAQAGTVALRATQTAEDPFNAWYNVSAFYARQDNVSATEQSLRAAIAAHPVWFKPHWALAQLLQMTHRGDEAAREAALARELQK